MYEKRACGSRKPLFQLYFFTYLSFSWGHENGHRKSTVRVHGALIQYIWIIFHVTHLVNVFAVFDAAIYHLNCLLFCSREHQWICREITEQLFIFIQFCFKHHDAPLMISTNVLYVSGKNFLIYSRASPPVVSADIIFAHSSEAVS